MGIQFKPLPDQLKPLREWKRRHIRTDNTAFRLFTTLTPFIFFVFCACSVWTVAWKKPIYCDNSYELDKVEKQVKPYKIEAIESYCYLNHLYTVTDKHATREEVVAQQGIRQPPDNDKDDHSHRSSSHLSGRRIRLHNYYIWIPYLLFFHALIFRLPNHVWRNLEGQRLAKFLTEKIGPKMSVPIFDVRTPEDNNEWKSHMEQFAKALIGYQRHGLHRCYALSFIFCELLNVIVLLLTIWITDIYLGGGGTFWNYGFDVLKHVLKEDRHRRSNFDDPFNALFPKTVKCNFRLAGGGDDSATSDLRDYYCTIGANVFNGKLFLWLWGWYFFLLLISLFVIVYRIFAIACPGFRAAILRRVGRVYPADRPFVNAVVDGLGYADWFFLKRISDNVPARRFGQICSYMHDAQGAASTVKFTSGTFTPKDDLLNYSRWVGGRKQNDGDLVKLGIL